MQEEHLRFPWRHRLAALLAGNTAVLLAIAVPVTVMGGDLTTLEGIPWLVLELFIVSAGPMLLALLIAGNSLPPWWMMVGAGMLTGFLGPFLFMNLLWFLTTPEIALAGLLHPRQLVSDAWSMGVMLYGATMPLGAVGGAGAWAYLAWVRRRQLHAINHTA